MIIKSDPATSGIFFAIWPRRTPEGFVAFEWLHWKTIPSWGWGSDATYEYRRFVPNKEYDEGKRPAPTWNNAGCHGQLRSCAYPHCTCAEVNGTTCPTGPIT